MMKFFILSDETILPSRFYRRLVLEGLTALVSGNSL
jgi:hypothetical protein